MREVKSIEGILEDVRIFARHGGLLFGSRALVSELAIRTEEGIVNIPYFAPIAEPEIEKMRDNPVRFSESYSGHLWFRRVHQLLKGSGLVVGMGGMPKYDWDNYLAVFFPEYVSD